MIMIAFTVRDDSVGAYLPLFFARSKGEAIRSFSDAVSDKTHQFAKHKGDYALYLVGQFDDQDGRLDGCDPVRVLSANEVAVVE